MIKRVEIVLSSNAKETDKALDGVLARLANIEKPRTVKLGIDGADVVKAELSSIYGMAKGISDKPFSLDFNVDRMAIATQLVALRSVATATGMQAGKDFGHSFAAAASAALAGTAIKAGAVGAGASRAAGAGAGGSSGGGGILGGLLGGFGLGSGKDNSRFLFGLGAVPLFGGLGSVGAIHLLLDSVIEITATLLPATIALTAFGLAGADAAKTIFNHFTNLHTVMDATGHAVPPLTNSMEKLHRAAAPEVYQLLGDALTVMNKKGGAFSQVALGAGHAIDQLFARATVAVGGAGSFMSNAVADLYKWGTLLGNIFGIIGNLLHAMPGYASILLNVFLAVTHALEVLTASPITQWVIHLGLAFHGAAVYGGLLVSGILAILPWASKLITILSGADKASTALRDLGSAASTIEQDSGKIGFFDKLKAGFQDVIQNTPIVVGRISSFGKEASTAKVAASELGTKLSTMGRFGNIATGALDLLTKVPVVGWGLAAIGIIGVGMVVALHNVNNATTQWIHSLQSGLLSTPLRSILPQIKNDISAVATQMKTASKAFIVPPAVAPHSGLLGMPSLGGFIHDWDELVGALGLGTSKFGELNAALQQFRAQGQQVSQFVIAPLAKEFGGTANAMTLMSEAGITSKQVLDAAAAAAKGNLGPFLALQQQVAGTAAAIRAMGSQEGALGNDLEMLDKQSRDSYKAAQTLNQGWDTFIGNMASSQSSFDTVALGMKTLDSSAQTVRHHLGDVSITINGVGKSMDGLKKNDIALNQAFTQQVVNSNALIGTWRTAGLAGNMFANGVKGAVGELLRFAKGSPEALAQLDALAEEAGYKGPAAFRDLSKWVGNTHDALKNMKNAADQATIQEALLSSSMHAQGNYIASQLIGDINNASMAYFHVKQDAEAYGNAVAKNGQQSDAARAARARLITDLIASGKAAHETTGQIAAMIAKVLTIPTKRAIQIVEHGAGSFTVTDLGGGRSITSTGQVRGFGGHTGAARGMFVTGGVPHQDSVLVRAMPGELIVPEPMVHAGLVDHLRGAIPGFASGGLVQTGNVPVLSGQAPVNFNASFISSMTSAMESAMKATAQAAMMAMRYTGGGPLGGSAAAAAAYAQSLLGRYGWSSQWPALNSVAMAESGWNMFAQNPSSGAYGIAQFINGPSEYAQYGGNSSTIGGQVIGFLNYIRSRYGSPNAAWAHEEAFRWYGDGLQNAVFSKPSLIGVGEAGPELVNVTPLRNNAAMHGAMAGCTVINLNVAVPPSANKNEIANEIWMMLRDLKRNRKMNLSLD